MYKLHRTNTYNYTTNTNYYNKYPNNYTTNTNYYNKHPNNNSSNTFNYTNYTFNYTKYTFNYTKPTTIPNIPSTIPQIPSTIITTIPRIMTTIITNIPTIINECNYYSVYSQCIFNNLTDEEIYKKLKKDILPTYPTDGISISINGSNGYSFQLTNKLNDNNNMLTDKESSVIDLGDCEETLRDIYHIDDEFSIIILKYLNIYNREKSLNYELFHPTTYEKLNLSLCEEDKYNVYIPIDLEENVVKEYSNGKKQGHDLFDSEDSFYKEVCVRYTSDGGSDVILDDRMSFYYNKVANYTTCPENCKYISYSVETEYLKCECGINNNDISTFDFNHIIGKNTYKSFYSTLKYSNYKVMRCYNLVFNFKIFLHNAGGILTLVLFIIYLIFIFLYCIKDVSPLKIYISKLLLKQNIMYEPNTNKKEKNIKISKNKSKENLIKDKSKNKKGKNPPKKIRVKLENEISNKSKSNEKSNFINNFSKRKNEKSMTNNLMTKNIRKRDKRMTKDLKGLNSNNLEIFQI